VNVSVFVRSHVERCLADMLGVCRVAADDDGDCFFRSGSATCYVRVEDEVPVVVQVYAIAATQVGRSARLLAEVNEVNACSRSAWVTWASGQVVVCQVMTAESVTAGSLGQACGAVAMIANDIGGMIAAVFGGSTPFSSGGQDVTSASGDGE
jgi:Putative bacterial sensory transduction regulator